MIGWYVHHQGVGHRQRLLAVAPHLRTPVVGLSTLAPPPGWEGRWLRLAADDDPPPNGDPTAGGVLHWAPPHHPGQRARTAALTAWAQEHDPDLVVVDVSVEVSLTLRLAGVPVVVAAMTGDRSDRPHSTAYDLAEALLAPWPADPPPPGWPQRWRDKTHFTGAFSRLDALPDPAPRPPSQRVLLLWGSGGDDVSAADLESAERATPGWSWHRPQGSDPGDVWAALHAADVVVCHGGHNAVAEVAAARRPAVVVAQARPHDEQRARAQMVDAAGFAVGLEQWPAPDAWPGLLARAQDLGGAGWTSWNDRCGATRAAAAVDALVERVRR